MDSPEVILGFPPPPRRVWIGPNEWAVKGVKRSNRKLKKAGAQGLTDFNKATIYYDTSRPARAVFDTVLHEFFHAGSHEFRLEEVKLTDERVATVMGNAWSQMLLDNPAVVEWINLATAYIKSQQEAAE